MRRPWPALALGLALGLAALATRAEGDGLFTVVRVQPARLQLFWRNNEGQPLRRLDRLASWLSSQGRTLSFGMNAGMFHADGRPVGLLVVQGRELSPLNLDDGQGNFFVKPNGVFLVDAGGAWVIDAARYAARRDGVRLATQSGPLLLQDGVIHVALRPTSASRYVRNGVCASGGEAVFVISERPVTLHEFASYLRDRLGCRDALYLDGAVSSLYAPALGRRDRWHDLGPLIATVD